MNLKKLFNFSKKDNGAMSAKNTVDFFEKLVTAKNAEGMYNLLGRLPNPDPVLRKTGKGIETLRLLEHEGQIATCISSRKSKVKSLNWTFKNANSKYDGFYDDLLKSLNTKRFISDVLSAPLYGYQPMEIIWEKNGKYVIPKEITAPPQEWFFFNTDNELCFKMKGKQEGLTLRPEDKKFLCPVYEPKFKNPYGLCILSLCFWDIAFKRGGYEFWAKFMEKYSMPYFIGKYDNGTSEEDKKNLLNCLVNMVQDAAAVIPNDSSVEIIEAAGKSASAAIYKDFIKMCDENVAKNILGQTLTTQSGDKGSYSLGKVHAEVREDIISADKSLVEETANKLLLWIHQINFGNNDCPVLELSADKKINNELAERDGKLHNLGVRFTPKYIQRAHNLEEDDFILINNTNKSGSELNFSEETAEGLNEGIGEINKFSEDVPKSVIGDFDKALKPVVEHFSKTKDPQEALEKIAEIYPDMDFDDLEESLARVIFISELWGSANAKA